MTTAGNENKKGLLDRLSQKERYQLAGLGIFLMVMASIVAVGLFQRSVSEIEKTTDQYEAALDFLATAGPAYAERATEGGATTHKKVDDEVLRKNDIKLTSFVAEQAEKEGITVSSYDEDELPFGNKKDGGPIYVEKQLRVEIRKAKMSELIKLLDRIYRSTEPVFIKRVDIRKRRRDKGQVRSIVTVATYVKKDAEG
jgi:hypothetical protein